MSAIAKPMVHSTVALNPSMVLIEAVTAISKRSTPAIGNQPAKHMITFHTKGGDVRDTTWKYASSGARDTEYTKILAAMSLSMSL